MEETTPDNYESYNSKVQKIQKKARERVFEKKNKVEQSKVSITDQERKFARDTMALENNPAFHQFEALCQFISVNQLGKLADTPPVHWMPESTTYGEKCAFNKGHLIGLQLQLSNVKMLWDAERKLQEIESKNKKSKSKG